MDNLTLTVFLVFAVYRVAQLVVYDDAPGDAMLKLRTKAGVYRINEKGEREGFWAKLLSCPFCIGLWVALPAAYIVTGPTPDFWLYWLAIAGGQAFLQDLAK